MSCCYEEFIYNVGLFKFGTLVFKVLTKDSSIFEFNYFESMYPISNNNTLLGVGFTFVTLNIVCFKHIQARLTKLHDFQIQCEPMYHHIIKTWYIMPRLETICDTRSLQQYPRKTIPQFYGVGYTKVCATFWDTLQVTNVLRLVIVVNELCWR